MRMYNEPKLEMQKFDAENIMTASDGTITQLNEIGTKKDGIAAYSNTVSYNDINELF